MSLMTRSWDQDAPLLIPKGIAAGSPGSSDLDHPGFPGGARVGIWGGFVVICTFADVSASGIGGRGGLIHRAVGGADWHGACESGPEPPSQ